jgi:meiotically up-regulated gene 157 (Mug157) protein
MFRPSDDATVYPFLIPSNYFAVQALQQLDELLRVLNPSHPLRLEAAALANTVRTALKLHASVNTREQGTLLAYEINGSGSVNLMDDANVPSLLALPYLAPDLVPLNSPVYRSTRRFVLSAANPFFFRGKAGEGIGGPHVGMDYIWPMSIILRGLTSTDDREKKQCLEWLRTTHAGTGFMHEAFHKDDPARFTRKWFAWANTLFGEFVWKIYRENKALLG